MNFKRNNNKGSVLLLAVGLLTVLAMLGTSFLLISRLDRQQSIAISNKSYAEPVAKGALLRVCQLLRADLNLSKTGNENSPFTSNTYKTANFPERWYRWIDCGEEYGSGSTEGMDYMIGTETKPTVLYPQQPRNGSVQLNANDPSTKAYEYETKIKDRKGNPYKVAISLLDLGSKVNVNTTKGVDSSCTYNFPAMIALNKIAGASAAASIDKGRETESLSSLDIQLKVADLMDRIWASTYSNFAGSNAFSIGDEYYLRANLSDPLAGIGRLANLPSKIPSASKKNLTTYNYVYKCGRYIPQRTAFRGQNLTSTWEFYDAISSRLNSKGKGSDFNSIITQLNLGNGNVQEMANAFTANSIAYRKCNPNNTTSLNTSYAFYNSFTKTRTYGLLPQLVFSEVYAYKKRQLIPGSNPAKYATPEAYAIEIYNPTTVSIDFSRYKLCLAGQEIRPESSKNKILPPNGHIVFYYITGDIISNPTTGTTRKAEESDFGFQKTWHKVTSMKFSNTSNLYMFHRVSGGMLPADCVKFSTECSISSGADSFAKCIQRDDNWKRGRCTIASYKDVNISGNPKGHKLGLNNGLTAADLPNDQYPCPIWTKGSNVTGLGDFSNIYLIAHKKLYSYGDTSFETGDNAFPHKIKNYSNNRPFKDEPGRGRLPLLSKPSLLETWGTGSNIYPDLPAGCLISELISCSSQHGTMCYFGRININTASKDVLAALPFITQTKVPVMSGSSVSYKTINLNTATAVDRIISYRQKTNRYGYRSSSPAKGYLTPGEVGIPLGKYVEEGMRAIDTTITERDWRHHVFSSTLYNSISNCVEVRSDTFGVYIRVTGDGNEYNYFGVIGRNEPYHNHEPAVMMFTELQRKTIPTP